MQSTEPMTEPAASQTRIAVFGRPGGGKSTLAQRIARSADLPLVQVDMLRYGEGGKEVSPEAFLERLAATLARPHWVLDGFASRATFEDTIRRATVLAYVDRPTPVHYWWVTKRLLLSPFRKPIGWPEGSPMWSSTIASYRFLRLSNRFWTPALVDRLLGMRPDKRVYVIRSAVDERALIDDVLPPHRSRCS